MAVRFEAGASAPTVGRLQRTPAFTGTPYTVVAWFRFDDDSVGSTEAFDFYSTDFSVDDWLELRAPNLLRVGTYDSAVDSASDAWQDATWHCMAMTRSATTQTGHVLDRGVVLSRSTTYSAAFQVEALLGYDGDGSAAGRAVTHYKCWTAALTHEELAREMQQFAPVRTADLVAYAKLEAHTDLSDEIAGSFSAVNATPSTVAGPSGVQDEWTGPRVASSATTVGTTSAGGLSINLPSGVAAGDLLMAFAANDTSVSWSAGGDWSLIDNGANGTAVQGACWAKIAAGSDTLTITGEANDIAVVTIRIPAAQHGVTDVTTITKGTAATGSSKAPDGPNCNPGTSGKYLWLTYFASDDDDNTTYWWPVEAAPISQTKSATGTSSCMVGVAYRWLEASSYNPSTFLLAASEEWRAQTFAIPAAASGSTGTLAATESGSDTAALVGDVLVEGSLAATESGSDVAALIGVALVSGTLAATETGDDAAVIAGSVLAQGTLAATESGSDAAAIEGVTVNVATGSLAATESGSDTAEIVGATLAQGTLAATESGADAAAITGLALVSGTLDATEAGSDTAVIAAVVLVQGSLDATESGSDIAAIEGSLAVISTGSLAATESGSDTATFAGVAPVSGALAATEAANDSAAVSGVVLVTGALDATETGSDTAAFASSTPVTTAYPGPAGRATKGERRRVVIRERVYEVNERDLPALLEAELLDRAPPVTAEVVEGPKPPRKRARKRARKAPQPVKTVAEVRETVQQIKRRIEHDDAWLAQALETVAQRVLERLQDEEDSIMLLLAA
jgi:hypothetical protein